MRSAGRQHLMVTEAVARAIEEIRMTFSEHRVDSVEDGQGGARVTVHDVDYGQQYRPARSWIGFAITFQYDASDCYPHLVDGGLARVDGQPLGAGFGSSTWNGAQATQVSRRSNGWRPGVDTAAGKLIKVLEWIRSR